MSKQIVQYFIINSDLTMTKGKCCSQVAHASQEITEKIMRNAYESRSAPKEYSTYMKWKSTGCAKIVLKASEEQLRQLMKRDDCIAIIDAGRTQVDHGSLTCIGFYPGSDLSDLFKDYKLL